MHAFRIDQEEVENLNNTTLDQLVGTGFASTTVMKDTYVPGATGTPEAPASGTPETPGSVTVPKTPFNQMDGADVTFSLNVKPIVPIPRSTRPRKFHAICVAVKLISLTSLRRPSSLERFSCPQSRRRTERQSNPDSGWSILEQRKGCCNNTDRKDAGQ